MRKSIIFCHTLFILFFVSSSNLWGMQDDAAKLKDSLAELSRNLRELKSKSELLVAKLGLLKDRLEGKGAVPPVMNAEQNKLMKQLESISSDLSIYELLNSLVPGVGQPPYEGVVYDMRDKKSMLFKISKFAKICESIFESRSSLSTDELSEVVSVFFEKNEGDIQEYLELLSTVYQNGKVVVPEAEQKAFKGGKTEEKLQNFNLLLDILKNKLCEFLSCAEYEKTKFFQKLKVIIKEHLSESSGTKLPVPPVEEPSTQPAVADAALTGILNTEDADQLLLDYLAKIEASKDENAVRSALKACEDWLMALDAKYKNYEFGQASFQGVQTVRDFTEMAPAPQIPAPAISGDKLKEAVEKALPYLKSYSKTYNQDKVGNLSQLDCNDIFDLFTLIASNPALNSTILLDNAFAFALNIVKDVDFTIKLNEWEDQNKGFIAINKVANFFKKYLDLSNKSADVLNENILKILDAFFSSGPAYRTQSLILLYTLFQTSYVEKSYVKWAVGLILTTTGQQKGSSSPYQYRNLGFYATYQLIGLIKTYGSPLLYDSVIETCKGYVDGSHFDYHIHINTGTQDGRSTKYLDPEFSLEGQAIKKDLLALIACMKVKKAAEPKLREIEKGKQDVERQRREEIRKKEEDELKKREEDARRKEEAARKLKEEEDRKQREAEEERKLEEARKKAEEEKQRVDAEIKKAKDATERKRLEEEAKIKFEAEQRKLKEEAERRQKELKEQEEIRLKEEQERKRKEAEEAEQRKKDEEVRQRASLLNQSSLGQTNIAKKVEKSDLRNFKADLDNLRKIAIATSLEQANQWNLISIVHSKKASEQEQPLSLDFKTTDLIDYLMWITAADKDFGLVYGEKCKIVLEEKKKIITYMFIIIQNLLASNRSRENLVLDVASLEYAALITSFIRIVFEKPELLDDGILGSFNEGEFAQPGKRIKTVPVTINSIRALIPVDDALKNNYLFMYIFACALGSDASILNNFIKYACTSQPSNKGLLIDASNDVFVENITKGPKLYEKSAIDRIDQEVKQYATVKGSAEDERKNKIINAIIKYRKKPTPK